MSFLRSFLVDFFKGFFDGAIYALRAAANPRSAKAHAAMKLMREWMEERFPESPVACVHCGQQVGIPQDAEFRSVGEAIYGGCRAGTIPLNPQVGGFPGRGQSARCGCRACGDPPITSYGMPPEDIAPLRPNNECLCRDVCECGLMIEDPSAPPMYLETRLLAAGDFVTYTDDYGHEHHARVVGVLMGHAERKIGTILLSMEEAKENVIAHFSGNKAPHTWRHAPFFRSLSRRCSCCKPSEKPISETGN